MADNWNDKFIAEFRANEGRVGGNFEGAPVVLVHHRGRTSGRDYVNPLMYLPDDNDPDTIYVFATKGGVPTNPDWYYNLVAASEGTVERGTATYSVTVHELTGNERDRIYDEQARRYPASPTMPGKPPACERSQCSRCDVPSTLPVERTVGARCLRHRSVDADSVLDRWLEPSSDD